MILGVVGAGVVGGTLAAYLKRVGHDVRVDDPPKGINGDFKDVEAIFICVPVDTLPSGVQDLQHLKGALKKYAPLHKPIYIRSSVIPKTCDNLRKQFKIPIYAMPEFLTERESAKSFDEQAILCGVEIEDVPSVSIQEERLERIFPDKRIILVANREAELAKYLHNGIGAVKVNFFNMGAKYAQKIRADYDRVLQGVLLSGYVNQTHTKTPGPDGKRGFAGKCFPKDTLALIAEAKRLGIQTGALECMMFENFLHRTDFSNDYKPPAIKFPDGFQLQGAARAE